MFKLQFHPHYDQPLKIKPMTKEKVLDCLRDGCLPGEKHRSARIECYLSEIIVYTTKYDALYDYTTGLGYVLSITEH